MVAASRPIVANDDPVSGSATDTSPTVPGKASLTLADPILNAAYDAILEVGVRRTTMVEVARRAGVSRMTVYRRYEDLPQLLAALLTVELGALLEATIERFSAAATVREQLSQAAAATCAALGHHPLLVRVLTLDPEAILPLVVGRFGSTQRRALDMVHVMIRAGQSDDGDGSIRDGDPQLMALTVVTTAQSFVFSSLVLADTDPAGLVYSELAAMVDGYLRPVR